MSKIFLSYRRGDSESMTGRIHDRLRAHFGDDELFQDVLSINYGDQFLNKTNSIVKSSTVFIPIIGKNWLDITINKHENGEVDYMRIEIEEALASDKLIIPALVENAKMPTREKLPESIKELYQYQAISIRPNPDFDHDINRLIKRLNDILDRKNQNGSLKLFLSTVLIAVAIIIISNSQLNKLPEESGQNKSEKESSGLEDPPNPPFKPESTETAKETLVVVLQNGVKNEDEEKQVIPIKPMPVVSNPKVDKSLRERLIGVYADHATTITFKMDNMVQISDPYLGQIQGSWKLTEFEFKQNNPEIEIIGSDGSWRRFELINSDVSKVLQIRDDSSRKHYLLEKK